MKFRIWYKGGLVVDGMSYEDWIAAPSENVLAVRDVYGKDKHGRTLSKNIAGGDWYWMTDTIYHGHTGDGENVWIAYDGPPIVPENARKKGVWTSDEEFEAVLLEMIAYE